MTNVYVENLDNSGQWTSYQPSNEFPNLQGEHISPTHSGEPWIILIMIIIIIIAVIIIISFANSNNSQANNSRSNNSRSNQRLNGQLRTNTQLPSNQSRTISNQLRANNRLQATSNNLSSTVANQNRLPTISNSINNVVSSEIGSVCRVDTDCRTQNCSNGFCQPHNTVTGQTGAFCLMNGTPNCTGRFECINGTCMATGNDLLEVCESNNDCRPFHVCTRAPFESTDEKICQFPIDPNRCVNGTCTGGSVCSGGQCLGRFGTPCILDSNCVGSCGGPSIARWDFENPTGGGWSTIASIPNNVKFEKVLAIRRFNNDDIWGFDPDNGLYYWKHDNPNRSWIRVLSSNHIGRLISDSKQRKFHLIDFAVAHSDAIYVLYRVSHITDESINRNLYVLYRLDMMAIRNAVSNSTQLNNIDLCTVLIPYNTNDGIQLTDEGEEFNRIIGMDAIMDQGKIITLLYGNCLRDGTRYYVFSHSGDNPYFNYVGPNHGYGLTSLNRIRLLPRLHNYDVYDNYNLNDNYCYFKHSSSYDLSNGDFSSVLLPKNERSRSFLGSENGSRRTTTLITNGSNDITDEESIELPINGDIVIHDYVLVRNDNRISVYLIATYENRTNIYFVPDINNEAIHTLPGHVSDDTRIAFSSNNLYIFSPGTCN